jgi:hypothetical protein
MLKIRAMNCGNDAGWRHQRTRSPRPHNQRNHRQSEHQTKYGMIQATRLNPLLVGAAITVARSTILVSRSCSPVHRKSIFVAMRTNWVFP